MIEDFIHDVPDFPKAGIVFKDISPLLADPKSLSEVIHKMEEQWQDTPYDMIAGLDARGFIFGSILAYKLGVPFIAVRKKGKLPGKTKQMTYDLEYGTATIEIQEEAFTQHTKQPRVLVVDDLLATGGTAKATCELVEALGGVVAGCAFVIELKALGGYEKLKPYLCRSILSY